MKKIKIFDPQDFPTYLPKLNNLYDDLFSHGKGFRARLVGEVSLALGLEERTQALLCQTIEFIHNASLLHDDLVDRSHLRRNKPAAWLKYTPEYAVLAGDYILARVMVNLSKHGNLALIQYTAEVISDLLEGEWIQDSLVRDFEISLEQLDRVHNLKTGSLFRWCLCAPFLALRREPDETYRLLGEVGSILGLLFQRSDDLLDFDIRNHEAKAVLGDLKSGYLNSFAVQLRDTLDTESRKRFYQAQSLGEVQSLIGEKKFKQCLEEFDSRNQKQIDLYFHYLDLLNARLDEKSRRLIEVLKPLPRLLYWRET